MWRVKLVTLPIIHLSIDASIDISSCFLLRCPNKKYCYCVIFMLLHKPLTCQLLLVDTKKYGDLLFWTQIQQKCEDPDRIKNTSKVKEKAWQITVFRWCDCGLRQVHHPADQRVPRHLQVSWWLHPGLRLPNILLKVYKPKNNYLLLTWKTVK